MRSPREVFDDPEQHWGFLTAPTDEGFEGQHFDRKEACRPDENGVVRGGQVSRLADQITECVSAFANSNRTGSLLALGITKAGEVAGINHLNDAQRTRIMNLDEVLINQTARVEFVPCVDESGEANQICLIYVPYAARGICETPGKNPKAWLRKGPQNVPMTHEQREQIRRDKKIVDFEQTYCCPYEPDDVDAGVLQEVP
jgi:predicted HTH transcriptional regulator